MVDWWVSDYHKQEALKTAQRLFDYMNLFDDSMTSNIQDELLLNYIYYGVRKSTCLDGEYTLKGEHVQEMFALLDLETDGTYYDEVLLNVLKRGLLTENGNARQFRQGFLPKARYLYQHVNGILEYESQNESGEFMTYIQETIEAWVTNIQKETYDTNLVCFRGRLMTIDEVFQSIDPQERRVETQGDPDSYTFEEFWEYYDDETPQQRINRWENAFESMDWVNQMDGGRKRRRLLTRRSRRFYH